MLKREVSVEKVFILVMFVDDQIRKSRTKGSLKGTKVP